MKRYATTWLLILSIVIAESHSYIPEKYASKEQNWIRTINWTMTVSWNVKFLANEINAILYFLAMFFYNKNKYNKATVVTFIFLCCIDLIMYLHNGKTLYYGSVYIWTLGIWAVTFYAIRNKCK